jgi:NAD(P)-dependent dehydrogenase (short-subunit alcohol dehydrogenase family)
MRNIEKGTDLAVTARKQGLPIKLLEMDIGNAESVTEAFAAITTTGAVDVLVNNAGISGSSPLEFTPEEDAYDNEFERLFGIRPS